MTTAHCLTVEVQNSHPTLDGVLPVSGSGLGYMVTFTLPANMDGEDPAAHPSFDAWAAAVRAAVLAAGDLPFHHDSYTRKVALANLMHDLADINRAFPLRIGHQDGTPAVQIHATDPLACQIELDFSDEDGDFTIVERNPAHGPSAVVPEQGRMGLIPAGRKVFPFDKPARAKGPVPPKKKNNAPKSP